jgi:hypothetical protein
MSTEAIKEKSLRLWVFIPSFDIGFDECE